VRVCSSCVRVLGVLKQGQGGPRGRGHTGRVRARAAAGSHAPAHRCKRARRHLQRIPRHLQRICRMVSATSALPVLCQPQGAPVAAASQQQPPATMNGTTWGALQVGGCDVRGARIVSWATTHVPAVGGKPLALAAPPL